VSQMKWIFQSLHALGLTIHLYQNMHRNATGAKFFISRIPLIGLVMRLGWRYRAEISFEAQSQRNYQCNDNTSSSILPSYGTAGSMIPRYLFCLFLCTAVPPAGFSIYIFINTTVTFIGTSGHSVQMSWIFVSTHIFIFSLEIFYPDTMLCKMSNN
jgi:hypothetical protein